jgi:hypothetical protein
MTRATNHQNFELVSIERGMLTHYNNEVNRLEEEYRQLDDLSWSFDTEGNRVHRIGEKMSNIATAIAAMNENIMLCQSNINLYSGEV